MAIEIETKGDIKLLILIAKGLVGGKTLILEDASGHLSIKVPSALWPWIVPGDQIYTTLGAFKVGAMSETPGLFQD